MKAKKKIRATGCVAANPHEGSRSEQLADFIFSKWGTVNPARRPDDYGIDLYCTLTETIDKRARVRDYFVAQVKSDGETWKFADQESVSWLVHHPIPIFLCVVNKTIGNVRIYHAMPRFYVWATGSMPNCLELKPGEGEEGEFVSWGNESTVSLSAPIVDLQWADIIDEDRMFELQKVFAHWLEMDRENCDLVRQGLLRFRMPTKYRSNNIPTEGVSELGLGFAEPKHLKRGIRCLAEAVECIGGQLGRRGERLLALEAALLLDQLQRSHPEAFENDLRFPHRVPGMLGMIVNNGLNEALGSTGYLYAGLEATETLLTDDAMVQRYLRQQALAATF